MSKLELMLAALMSYCIVAFLMGCLGIFLCFFPITMVFLQSWGVWVIVLVFSILLIIFPVFIVMIFGTIAPAIHSYKSKKARLGARTKYAAKIFSKWRTSKGKVVGYEDEVDNAKYHISLVTDKNERLEVETTEGIWNSVAEGVWGYAHVQGDWMGAFTPDAELYLKMTGR